MQAPVHEPEVVAVLEETPPKLPPICVDLDGTLLRTDTLWETTIAHLKARPWKGLLLPIWLWGGKAHLKQRLAEGVQLDCASLPYTPELLAYLRKAHDDGRELVLVSGCDRAVGQQVAQHLGFFSDVITSDGHTNLTGRTKARLLNERYGRGGFDYAGNGGADFPVWEASRRGLVVNASPQLTRHLLEETSEIVE